MSDIRHSRVVPAGPHDARRYGEGCADYDFFAPLGRCDGILIDRCFCGADRRHAGHAASSTWWCSCGIEWNVTWGKLTWVNRAVHDSRPVGVVA